MVRGLRHSPRTIRVVAAASRRPISQNNPLARTIPWLISQVIYPVDVVKTIVQSANPSRERLCARHVAARLLREEGVGRFYRGLAFTVLRAGPVAGILLPVFDLTLSTLRALRD